MAAATAAKVEAMGIGALSPELGLAALEGAVAARLSGRWVRTERATARLLVSSARLGCLQPLLHPQQLSDCAATAVRVTHLSSPLHTNLHIPNPQALVQDARRGGGLAI